MEIYWKKWQAAGVNRIGDLFENGAFITYSILKNKFDLGNDGTFWKYLQMRHCLGSTLVSVKNVIVEYIKLPHVAHTASVFYKMSKEMFGGTCDSLKLIWQNDLGVEIEDNH